MITSKLGLRAPEPPEPWEGIRDATSEGSVSAQIDIVTIKSYVGDENCLFLNVYTPTLTGSSLPVMFYVPGGGLIYGSGNTDLYAPDFLVEKDVVVVTMNYRLGALGFLSLETPEAPGNAGLKDVVQALRWVKENIHNYGGDSGNLTAFGESAGAGIVSVLTGSPSSKHLINRAIIQSGTAISKWINQKDPIDLVTKLAKVLGCDAVNVDEILEFLIATPAKNIVEAQGKISSFDDVLDNPPEIFAITVEKEFSGIEAVATEAFIDLLKSGRVAKVPIMIGTTALEFGFAKTTDDLQPFIPQELHVERDSEISLAIVKEIKKLYFKGDEESLLEYCQLVSDKFINVDVHRHIEYLLHSTNIPVFFYKFDYVGALNIADKITSTVIANQPMHCDDLGYLFKNDFQKDVEPTPGDLKMRERMVRLWTNFAKTGNPTPDLDQYITVNWLPMAAENKHYLHLAKELSLGVNYDDEKMKFWDGLYEKYYKIWDQPNTTPSRAIESVAVATLLDVSERTPSSETIGTASEVAEKSSDLAESNGVLEMSSESLETEAASNLAEASEVVATSSALIEIEATSDVVASVNKSDETKEKLVESSVKRTSREIKMVQNNKEVPKDVVRANDPPENDLPKNTGVNNYVNFFESLGGKKSS